MADETWALNWRQGDAAEKWAVRELDDRARDELRRLELRAVLAEESAALVPCRLGAGRSAEQSCAELEGEVQPEPPLLERTTEPTRKRPALPAVALPATIAAAFAHLAAEQQGVVAR
jgi:hypothetical protein